LLAEAHEAAQNAEQVRLAEISRLKEELCIAKESRLKAEAARIKAQRLFDATHRQLQEEKCRSLQTFESSQKLAKEYEEMKRAEESLLAVMKKAVENRKREKHHFGLHEEKNDQESGTTTTDYDHTTITAAETTKDKYSLQAPEKKQKKTLQVSGKSLFELSEETEASKLEEYEAIEAVFYEHNEAIIDRTTESQESELYDISQVPTMISIEKDRQADVGSLSSEVILEKIAGVSNSISSFLLLK